MNIVGAICAADVRIRLSLLVVRVPDEELYQHNYCDVDNQSPDTCIDIRPLDGSERQDQDSEHTGSEAADDGDLVRNFLQEQCCGDCRDNLG